MVECIKHRSKTYCRKGGTVEETSTRDAEFCEVMLCLWARSFRRFERTQVKSPSKFPY